MKRVLEQAVELFSGLSVAEAELKAQAARQDLINSQAGLDQATFQRATAEEQGDEQDGAAAEAAVIMAQRQADRAARLVEVAERKLATAQEAEAAAAKAAKRKALENAVHAHNEGAGKAQRAIEQLITAVNDIDESVQAMHSAGVSPNCVIGLTYGVNVHRKQVEMALCKGKVLTGYTRHDMPSLSEWAESVGKTALLP